MELGEGMIGNMKTQKLLDYVFMVIMSFMVSGLMECQPVYWTLSTCISISIATDKMGYLHNIFLISL